MNEISCHIVAEQKRTMKHDSLTLGSKIGYSVWILNQIKVKIWCQYTCRIGCIHIFLVLYSFFAAQKRPFRRAETAAQKRTCSTVVRHSHMHMILSIAAIDLEGFSLFAKKSPRKCVCRFVFLHVLRELVYS